MSDDDVLEYDLTEIIDGGWVEEASVKVVSHEKIILLTEGKSDTKYIGIALKELFPSISPYYHFINFDEFKVESSASAIAKLVTAFAACGVQHPVIALFDNDTTGKKELRSIVDNLPPNIRVLKYPDIDIARRYPTIGPTGKKVMNVNGKACSIEMYFGKNALFKDNELIPVVWGGFEKSMSTYTGEIQNKDFVQKKFNDLYIKKEADFSELKLILKTIFKAFH